MTSNSKFLFDTEFGSATPLHVKPDLPDAPPLVYTEEDKEQLCTDAFQDGLAAGKEEALQSIEASAADIMRNVEAQLLQISSNYNTQMDNIRCEATSLAFAVASKLSTTLVARQPEAEILSMIENCLEDLRDEPRFVLRASAIVCDALSEKINQLASASGFEGNIILLPDDTKTNSDCRVEWADGGVERDMTSTIQKIEEIVNRFISSSNDAG